MELSILNRHQLTNIPSASGIEIVNGSIFVIGDNSPWLFKLDEAYNVLDKFQIAAVHELVADIIPKAVKSDFETMTSVQYENEISLLKFGSGSKSPQRDVLVQVILNGGVNYKTYSLENFYKNIREFAKLDIGQLNIEGAAADAKNIYLFNRGKNIVFKLNLIGFLEHLKTGTICPVPEVFHFKLPEIKGIEAGFSGAAMAPDETKIIFTASVENTTDWYEDGEVLGSFVGVVNLQKAGKDVNPVCEPLMDKGSILKIKVESVAIQQSVSQNRLHLLLVTDNDGGVSELLEMDVII
jgi:hypothetical protein